LRQSCHACPAKQGKSHSDITIADFWGIENYTQDFDDDKGCGAVFINTEKGKKHFILNNITTTEYNIENIIKYNSAYSTSVAPHKNRDQFLRNLDTANNLQSYINKQLRPNLTNRIKRLIRRYIKAALSHLHIIKKS